MLVGAAWLDYCFGEDKESFCIGAGTEKLLNISNLMTWGVKDENDPRMYTIGKNVFILLVEWLLLVSSNLINTYYNHTNTFI